MKYFSIIFIIFSCFLFSCNDRQEKIVSNIYIDTLINDFSHSAAYKTNNEEIDFWKNRIDPKNPGMINESRYAMLLVRRFNLSGDINDIKTSDSILKEIHKTYNYKEAAPYLMLLRSAILQHHFVAADSLLEKAKKIGIKPYEALIYSFDVDFELGRYALAEGVLKNIVSGNDFGYYFRHSKLQHYKGEVDSAITDMQKAADLATSDPFLKQAALSNLADLYLHNGQLKKAYSLYQESLKLSASDLHSLMGIGWIALVHDKNDLLAKKIFEFAQTKTRSAEPLYKLMHVAQANSDTAAQIKYATGFVAKVTDSIYGNMYNKYLIEIYTGILDQPAKAEIIAKNELANRATPQTYAWYVWSLFSNNKPAEAYAIYEKFVSGKPLEGIELYWMGKMMKGLNKGYNAQEFFKAANKNKYDLSPAIEKDLAENLEK